VPRDRSGGVWIVALVAVASAAVAAQQSTSSRRAVAVDAAALYVSPASLELASRPDLRRELLSGPHQYFRFVKLPFSQAVCSVLRPDLDRMPTVALHGDAHVGQYAVTDAGRGLTDFEDTAAGPAAIDLVRFGVSIRLVAGQHGWATDPATILRRFLSGYRQGLSQPDRTVAPPAAAGRLEGRFQDERPRFLSWAESLMSPVDPGLRSALEESTRRYARSLLAAEPDLDAAFFRVESVGRFGLGVGSALDEKYLLRVRGPGESPDDDVILEAREVTNPGVADCIEPGSKANPFRLLAGRVRVPYRPLLGFFQLRRKPFWVHAWLANFVELDPDTSVRNPAELAEIAFESGVQLARAHFEGPLRETRAARDRQRVLLDTDQARLEQIVTELAEITTEAWQRFRAAAARDGVADARS